MPNVERVVPAVSTLDAQLTAMLGTSTLHGSVDLHVVADIVRDLATRPFAPSVFDELGHLLRDVRAARREQLAEGGVEAAEAAVALRHVGETVLLALSQIAARLSSKRATLARRRHRAGRRAAV